MARTTKNGLPPGEGGPGRPPTLTPAIHQTIISALRSGQTLYTAGGLVGVDAPQIALWLKKGARLLKAHQAAIDNGLPEPTHTAHELRLMKLNQDANRAVATAEAEGAAAIRLAGRRPAVKKTTRTRTETMADGTQKTVTETTEEELPPDWRAEAWWMERRYARSWGKAAALTLNLQDGLPAAGDEDEEDGDGLSADEAELTATTLLDELARMRARRQGQLPAGEEPEDAEVVDDHG